MHAATGSKSPSGSSPDRLRYNCALVHGAREEVAFSDADILHPAHLTTCPGTCPHRSSIIRSPVRKKRCLRLDLVLCECPRLTVASVHSLIQLCNNQRRRYVDIEIISYPTGGARSPHHLHQYAKPYTRTLHGRVDVERVLLRERRSRYVYLLACLLYRSRRVSCVPSSCPCELSRLPHTVRASRLVRFPFSLPLWSGRYAYARTGRCGGIPQIV